MSNRSPNQDKWDQVAMDNADAKHRAAEQAKREANDRRIREEAAERNS